MKANDTCLRCGSPCFTLATTQECGCETCQNYSAEFAAAQWTPVEKPPLGEIKELDLSHLDFSNIFKGFQKCQPKFIIPFGDWITNADKDWRTTLPDLAKDPTVFEADPKPTDQCSVDQLKSWGTVGLYRLKK